MFTDTVKTLETEERVALLKLQSEYNAMREYIEEYQLDTSNTNTYRQNITLMKHNIRLALKEYRVKRTLSFCSCIIELEQIEKQL